MRRKMVVMVVTTLFLLLLSFFFFDTSALFSGSRAFTKRLRGHLFSEGTITGHTPCKRSLKFAPVPLPVTALASVQGSGNTWMRHLLQQLTGIYTGSIYSGHGDQELLREGYYGETVRNGSVIAVKTHGLPGPRFGRAVVVIRDPFDAMVADFNRRASKSHIGIAPVPAYFHYWNAFSKEYVKRWVTFHASWVRFKGPLLFVNFDDLVHSLGPTVEKLADFLKHPSLAMDVQCTLDNRKGVAKRRYKVSFDKREVFSKNLTRYINGRLEEVQGLLADRFPELSKAITAWKRNDTALKDLQFKPLPSTIS